MRKKSLISLLAAVCLLAATGWLWINQESSTQTPEKIEPARIPVITTSPQVKDVTVYVEAIGVLQPAVNLEIWPQASGILQEVLISEGQWVQEDTPLFKIDSRVYENKVLEAKAQLTIDSAHFKAIQKKLERFNKLAQKDLIAQTEWDDIEAQVEKARGSIALDAARVKTAELDLEQCTLKSPLAGRVGKLDAHPGQLITQHLAKPLATISKMDPLLIEFSVTEKEFPLLPKEECAIEMQSLAAGQPCPQGTLTFVDNHFDSKSGLLLIRGTVHNADFTLRPGQSMRIQLPVMTIPAALLIPQKAVRHNQKGPYVYIIQDDMSADIRQIVLGKEHGLDQIVLEGLTPSDRLVLDGHLRLSPGLKVDIKA